MKHLEELEAHYVSVVGAGRGHSHTMEVFAGSTKTLRKHWFETAFAPILV
jgi:hypothetical protein